MNPVCLISPILAQEADGGATEWLKNAFLVIGGITATVYYVREIFRKPETKIQPQPLNVILDKELNEKFASKKEFDEHVKTNSDRHAVLFNQVDSVKIELYEKFSSIQRLLGRIEQKIDQHL